MLVVGVLIGSISLLSHATPSAAAGATTYRTTFQLTAPVGAEGIDRVVWVWTTSQTTGDVGESGLSDWSMELWAGTTLVYQDVIMVGGVLQDVGGNPRVADDTFWQFDLDSMQLLQFRNFFFDASGAGTHYLVTDNESIPDDGQVWISIYVDGGLTDIVIGQLADQSTTFVTTPATTRDGCKAGGWQHLSRADGTSFKAQGDCIQYANTGK
jgi:hypothetical protein